MINKSQNVLDDSNVAQLGEDIAKLQNLTALYLNLL